MYCIVFSKSCFKNELHTHTFHGFNGGPKNLKKNNDIKRLFQVGFYKDFFIKGKKSK